MNKVITFFYIYLEGYLYGWLLGQNIQDVTLLQALLLKLVKARWFKKSTNKGASNKISHNVLVL